VDRVTHSKQGCQYKKKSQENNQVDFLEDGAEEDIWAQGVRKSRKPENIA
jgi:hypothetical protein